jgi:eukaryotic-like serine/threonine-protein kinase
VIEVGRYLVYDAIASGGMAAVHLGRIGGPAGFSRIVAVKRLHPHLAADPKFRSMFLDEARVASRVQHPNVVGIIDIATHGDELLLVMEYVRGESLAALLRAAMGRNELPSLGVVSAIVLGSLYGLHAAHEVADESGRPMEIVHRDVSPQNILVGADGVPRVVDFGIAKAISRLETTREGEIKGKLGYMSPEQLRRGRIDRRTDVYAAAVVLWEALTCRRLFVADDAAGVIAAILEGDVPAPSTVRSDIGPALDEVVRKGLRNAAEARFASALEMAEALARAAPPASPAEVGAWVAALAGDRLSERARRVASLEQQSSGAVESVPAFDERRRIVDAETSVEDLAALELRTAVMPVSVARSLPASRRWGWTLGAGVSAFALAALGAVYLRPRARVEPPAASAPVIAETAPAASTPVIAETHEPAPTAETPAAASSRKETIPAARPSRPQRPAVAAPRAPTAHASTASPAPPAPADCDPSFTIDENGIKRFKRWCTNR